MPKSSPLLIIPLVRFLGTLNSGWVFLGISVQICIMGKFLTCSNSQRILKGNETLLTVSGIALQSNKLTTWMDYFCWYPACKTSPSIVIYPHQIVLRQNYAPFPPISIPCYTYVLEWVGDFPHFHHMINHSNRKHVTRALYNCDYPLNCAPPPRKLWVDKYIIPTCIFLLATESVHPLPVFSS